MSGKPLYEDELKGVLEHFVYRHEESGFAVARVKSEDTQKEIVVVGKLIGANVGERVLLQGRWILHPEYGRQLEVANYQIEHPVSKDGIVKYLSSTLIKGIGPKTAEKIVQKFGEEALEIIEQSPGRLEEVEGIGKSKRQMIEKGWKEQKELRNIMLFLQKYEISTNLALKIIRTYGDQAYSVLRSNPYKLTEDVHGIGFKIADRIASNIGIPKDSSFRISAGIFNQMLSYADDGHCFAYRNEMISKVSELLDVKETLVGNEIANLMAKEKLYGEGELVYHPFYYHSERKVAQKLISLIKSPVSSLTEFDNVDWTKVFQWLKGENKIDYTPKQQEAIKVGLTNKVTVLTGGPGTGKSTITAAITAILKVKRYSFLLAAPTGRAAKRLNEVTRYPAQTIHRMLEYAWFDGLKFQRNESNPLDTDVLILDEASMIDILLFNNLLKAMAEHTHLIIIGDIDQLPSVGAGNVLRDIINSQSVPVIRLDKIFRQAEGGGIVFNAHGIREGLMPQFDKESGEFFFFKADDPAQAAEITVNLVTDKIPKVFGFNSIKEIQVLAPMYKGLAGVNELNSSLQARLNPHKGSGKEVLFGERILRVGDRVIQLRNDYEKGVFNGDLGIITQVDREEQTLTIVYDEREIVYDFSELDQITHSYAISIHKSQGSEFPVVVIPLLTQHFIMLQRNLLYTAVTRAKKMVVIVGSRKAIELAINNKRTTLRNTRLKELLISNLNT